MNTNKIRLEVSALLEIPAEYDEEIYDNYLSCAEFLLDEVLRKRP